MKITAGLALFFVLVSCSGPDRGSERIISVSIAPFKYFVEAVAGDNFDVNVMVPAGANPHIYEPYPDQITRLRKSVAYISNGYLGFEMAWLSRFYEMNRSMKKLSLGESIEPIMTEEHHDHGHSEAADPHYWVSPVCAAKIASSVKDFLVELDPVNRDEYEKNYILLSEEISEIDSMARGLNQVGAGKIFMIYHPNLAYLARDYGLEEVAVEHEGKEPSPLRLRELIDLAKKNNIRTIMVQKEYDTRNAMAVAREAGGTIAVIDPLSEDWYTATGDIIRILKNSLGTK